LSTPASQTRRERAVSLRASHALLLLPLLLRVLGFGAPTPVMILPRHYHNARKYFSSDPDFCSTSLPNKPTTGSLGIWGASWAPQRGPGQKLTVLEFFWLVRKDICNNYFFAALS